MNSLEEKEQVNSCIEEDQPKPEVNGERKADISVPVLEDHENILQHSGEIVQNGIPKDLCLGSDIQNNNELDTKAQDTSKESYNEDIEDIHKLVDAKPEATSGQYEEACKESSLKESQNDCVIKNQELVIEEQSKTIRLLKENATKESQNKDLINNQRQVIEEQEEKIKHFEEQHEDSSRESQNEDLVNNQKLVIEKQEETIAQLGEKCKRLEQIQKDIEMKLDLALKQKEIAIKEKEAMVIKYAVSEKNVLEQKQINEQTEKKYKEAVRENEILLHKAQTMSCEKMRICQMLDNKCYEHKAVQQELEKAKFDMSSLETKLKWCQINLKTEIDAHKECQKKVESLNSKVQDCLEQIQQAKKEAQDSIKNFHHSQENRAHVLDQQLKDVQATLILQKHEKDEKEKQVKNLQIELERMQAKQMEMLHENNNLSLKVQQLERERSDSQLKLSELRGCADQQRLDAADLLSKTAQLEQLKLQLNNERDQLQACKEQMNLLKQRNVELESDMESCRTREAELLIFTQQLTDKNVRLQSEFTAMEAKVQQLLSDQSALKRSIKEQETRNGMLTAQLAEDHMKYMEENEQLTKSLDESLKLCEKLKQEVADQKGENVVVKRKLELSLREVNKELQQCRKRIEQYESMGNTSSSSSNSSLSSGDRSNDSPANQQVKVIQPDAILDRQTLIEHIVKLQRISAKKSEKIDFLEEHVNTLFAELQKKTRLLQTYIVREQSGTLTSNKMDNNKANIAKLSGVMASMYSSRVADENLTLELSLDINRKLQAILEDALLKNITLKENVDTLGAEIDRLNKLLKQ